MFAVLSPAKSLDFDSTIPVSAHTLPQFTKEAAQLIDVLRQLSPADISALMALSDTLARLNFNRYAEWSSEHSTASARQAMFAFDGDVYDGLSARTLNAAQVDYAQTHLGMLSGLYGLLRPLDLMHPYRLEMGTRLGNPGGKDLYAFWADKPTHALNAALEAAGSSHLVNLASNEYFKAVQVRKLARPVIECVFEDEKAGKYKIVSFFAKKARGLMARHLLTQRVDQIDGIKAFDAAGYAWCAAASDGNRLVFRRSEAALLQSA